MSREQKYRETLEWMLKELEGDDWPPDPERWGPNDYTYIYDYTYISFSTLNHWAEEIKKTLSGCTDEYHIWYNDARSCECGKMGDSGCSYDFHVWVGDQAYCECGSFKNPGRE